MKYGFMLAACAALATSPAAEAATKVRVMYTAVAPYASAFIAKDQGFFESVRRGNVLTIDNTELKLSASLRGSGKALTDLGACVETDGKSVPKVQMVSAPTAPALTAPALAIPAPLGLRLELR